MIFDAWIDEFFGFAPAVFWIEVHPPIGFSHSIDTFGEEHHWKWRGMHSGYLEGMWNIAP